MWAWHGVWHQIRECDVAQGCVSMRARVYGVSNANNYYYVVIAGCPANEPPNEEGVTPQKLAKAEGLKDAMKELKKLTSFQDKVARGAKPKGYAEPWAVKVCCCDAECFDIILAAAGD